MRPSAGGDPTNIPDPKKKPQRVVFNIIRRFEESIRPLSLRQSRSDKLEANVRDNGGHLLSEHVEFRNKSSQLPENQHGSASRPIQSKEGVEARRDESYCLSRSGWSRHARRPALDFFEPF
jgi:hypothetical protein